MHVPSQTSSAELPMPYITTWNFKMIPQQFPSAKLAESSSSMTLSHTTELTKLTLNAWTLVLLDLPPLSSWTQPPLLASLRPPGRHASWRVAPPPPEHDHLASRAGSSSLCSAPRETRSEKSGDLVGLKTARKVGASGAIPFGRSAAFRIQTGVEDSFEHTSGGHTWPETAPRFVEADRRCHEVGDTPTTKKENRSEDHGRSASVLLVGSGV